MSDGDSGSVHRTADGGLAGSHPKDNSYKVRAGPTTSREFNRLQIPLIPVACWRVDDIRLAFDSSMVLPDAKDELQLLSELLQIHPDSPISLFGHADPSGADDYNKFLSGHRAAAVYGLLTRRTEVWEDLYSNGGQFAGPAAGDQWGSKSTQTMLAALGYDSASGDAVKEFQSGNGLAADGDAGPATRKKLYLAYMDCICVDAQGKPFTVDKSAFLGRNADPAGKGDFQGCGEFNPLLIFSQQEEDEFQQADDKTDRNAANAPNRRVIALLFRPGSRVTPSKWPCPRAKEGVSGCRKRFWSDGEQRRSLHLPAERKFEETHDTFACRFYHRLAVSSPCEKILRVFKIRLFDPLGTALPGAAYRVSTGTREVRGHANDDGDVIILDLPVPNTCLLQWSRPDPPVEQPPELTPEQKYADLGDAQAMEEFQRIIDENPQEFEYERRIFVDAVTGDQQDATISPGELTRRRLHNLGYSVSALLEAQIRAFQRDSGQEPTGFLADVEADVKKRHDGLTPTSELNA